MGEWIETYKGAVVASEYDSETHMNSQIYVSRFDQATWFLLQSIGITPRTVKRARRRIAVVRQSYQFLEELRGGELVVIQSGFVAIGSKFFRFLHRMLDGETGRLIATSDYTAVEASLEPESPSRCRRRSAVSPSGAWSPPTSPSNLSTSSPVARLCAVQRNNKPRDVTPLSRGSNYWRRSQTPPSARFDSLASASISSFR